MDSRLEKSIELVLSLWKLRIFLLLDTPNHDLCNLLSTVSEKNCVCVCRWV